MKNKITWLEVVLVVLPFVALAALWHRLPMRLPMHWNLQGEVDRWSSNRLEIFILPLISLGLILFIHILPRLDPKLRMTFQKNDRMQSALQMICIGLVILFNVCLAVQLTTALGFQIASGQIIRVGLLISLAVMGNYMGNLRPNYFIGIRTPWTLENPQTWRATHRLGGRLMFFGSLGLLVLGFFVRESVAVILLVTFALLLCLWAFLYSWHHFRSQVETGKAR